MADKVDTPRKRKLEEKPSIAPSIPVSEAQVSGLVSKPLITVPSILRTVKSGKPRYVLQPSTMPPVVQKSHQAGPLASAKITTAKPLNLDEMLKSKTLQTNQISQSLLSASAASIQQESISVKDFLNSRRYQVRESGLPRISLSSQVNSVKSSLNKGCNCGEKVAELQTTVSRIEKRVDEISSTLKSISHFFGALNNNNIPSKTEQIPMKVIGIPRSDNRINCSIKPVTSSNATASTAKTSTEKRSHFFFDRMSDPKQVSHDISFGREPVTFGREPKNDVPNKTTNSGVVSQKLKIIPLRRIQLSEDSSVSSKTPPVPLPDQKMDIDDESLVTPNNTNPVDLINSLFPLTETVDEDSKKNQARSDRKRLNINRWKIAREVLLHPGIEFSWKEFYQQASDFVKSADKEDLKATLWVLIRDGLLHQEDSNEDILAEDNVWQKEISVRKMKSLCKYQISIFEFQSSMNPPLESVEQNMDLDK